MRKNNRAMNQAILKHSARKTKQPQWIKPMLATLTKDYFSDPAWLYECKFDGIRILAYKNGSKVDIYSRNKIRLNESYPNLVQALQKQPVHSFIIDGEIVMLHNNVSSFELLQQHLSPELFHDGDSKIYYYLFDIMYINGYDTTAMPLLLRKELLQKNIIYKDPLRYTQHILKDGVPFYKKACTKKWEGIIAKNSQSTYVQKRSRSWLKFKCINQQELVIGGFTDPAGSRVGFGALLMGYYENGKLKYAGKVGTGFDTQELRSLSAKMKPLKSPKSHFAPDPALPFKDVHWLKPKLVAEIGFAEWTRHNKLRHGRYIGLRIDKKAHEVVQELPSKT